MKNKIKLTLTLILISILQAKSQTYFRSDTNLITISGSTITSRPNTGGTPIYFETHAFSFTGLNDTIAFSHSISNNSGTSKILSVQLIDTNGNVFQTLLNFTYSGSNNNDEKFVITSQGKYKVRFTTSRSTGNGSQNFTVSSMAMGTPLVGLAVKNSKPNKPIKPQIEDEDPIQIFDYFYRMIFEGTYKDFLQNYAEPGKIYYTSTGYKIEKM